MARSSTRPPFGLRRRLKTANERPRRRGCCGASGLQALRDELGVKPGQKVFISGGAGGAGTFAIQIAKWLGAHVTTTALKRGEALVLARLRRGDRLYGRGNIQSRRRI
jgi:hypothetical protein